MFKLLVALDEWDHRHGLMVARRDDREGFSCWDCPWWQWGWAKLLCDWVDGQYRINQR